MKIMIASDLHGSANYCRLLLEAYEKEKAERLFLLGDLLYHGPRNPLPEEYDPKRVIELLNGYQGEILCVRGNCEAEVDQMVLEFPVLAEYAVLPLGKRLIFAAHGHQFHPAAPPKLKKGDILLNGHTHVPAWTEMKDFLYLNPGSVTFPKEGSPHSYMTLDTGKSEFLWKTMEGNVFHSLCLDCV